MFDRIDPALLPFLDSEARWLLQGGQLHIDDHQALLDEAKRKRAVWESTLNPTKEQLLAFTHYENQQHAASGRDDDQFWEGLKKEWRAAQSPSDHPDQPITPSPVPERLIRLPEEQRPSRQVADEAFSQAIEGKLQNEKSKGINLRTLAEKFAKAAEDSKSDPAVMESLNKQLDSMRQGLGNVGKEYLESSERTIQSLLRMQETASHSRSREVERAVENALKRAEDRARAERDAEETGRRLGFTPIGGDPPISSPPESNLSPKRVLLWAMFGVAGTLILQELHVPLWLSVPFWAGIGVALWQWHRISKSRAREFLFWAIVVIYMVVGFLYAFSSYKSQRAAEDLQRQYDAFKEREKQTQKEIREIDDRIKQRNAEIEQSQKAVDQSQQNRNAETKRIEGAKTIDAVSNTNSRSTSNAPLSALAGIPFKGGNPQRLDLLMKEAGYNGSTVMTVLIVGNDDNSVTEIWVGTDPKVSEKHSWRLDGGSFFNFPGGEDTTRVYIRSAKDGKVNVTYRPR